MASDKLDFTFGNIVIVKQIAPKQYKPDQKGCICGIRTIDSNEIALKFNQMIGSEVFN